MRTRDLDQATEEVSRVYCPHDVKVVGKGLGIDVKLDVRRPTFQPIVELSYNAPVVIDAGSFPRLFLMMHCSRGAARTIQEGQASEWRHGQTMPFSAGCETKLWFDASFAQRGVRLSLEALEAQCARWLGHPLDGPLRFRLCPFTPALERSWQRSLAFLELEGGAALAFSPVAKAAFDEFLLTLLLHEHPHTFTDMMAQPVAAPVPSLVRRAESFMTENAASPITVSDVAGSLGVSLRSLQSGFRQWRNTTPSAFLRQVRLRRAREELLASDGEVSVTAVALRYGFAHLGRFSAHYHSAFGEKPGTALRRSRSYRKS